MNTIDRLNTIITMLIIGSLLSPVMPMNMEITGSQLVGQDIKDARYLWRYGGPYGYYCGLGWTSKMFDEPINNVDRACQLHDTCISASGAYLNCACNEQLMLRMYDTCPETGNATYYRDQIIRAMNVGTSLCSSECNLVNRYFISSELGFNGVPFYGPQEMKIEPIIDNLVLYSLIDKKMIRQFAIDNLEGKLIEHLGSFRKLSEPISISIPENEILMLLNPMVDKSPVQFMGHSM